MNQFDLNERVAVVTGGAQGIGFSIAQRFLQSGARVAIWDMDREALEHASKALQHDGSLLGVHANIAQRSDIDRAVEESERALGPLAILVHSAGIGGKNATVADYPPEEWARVVEINLNAAFNVNQAVIRRMIDNGYGRVVNIASIAGKEGNPNAAAYSAAKAGLIALTKSMGKELAGMDIAVNCVTPAAAKTRIFEQITQAQIDYMLSKIPRGRFVTVEEIASMVTWLASKENSFTTGAVFDLSGGRATY
jgi:3-oxoacyl-[acyl-carrier protein] reductase